MTQPAWNPNPYADPRGYSDSSAAQQLSYIQGPMNTSISDATGFQTGLPRPVGSFARPGEANAWSVGATPYGGYAGGFIDTRNMLLRKEAAAAGQQAPRADFSQARGYLGEAGDVLASENVNLAALHGQAAQLRWIANGGQTAADTALEQGQAQTAAAQQSMAAGAGPGASYSAAQRGGAANTGYAAQQTVGNKGALDYQQQIAARQELAQVQEQQAAALSGARGLAQQRVLGVQGIAEFNPGLKEQQDALNAETATGYNTALLGEQQAAQQAGMQANVNANNYYLGTRGMSVAQQGLAIGAAGSAIGAGATQLGGAFSSNPNSNQGYSSPPGGSW